MIIVRDNLKKYLELAGLTNREFGKKIGYDEQTVSRVLNYKEEPTKKFIENTLFETGMKFENVFEIKYEE